MFQQVVTKHMIIKDLQQITLQVFILSSKKCKETRFKSWDDTNNCKAIVLKISDKVDFIALDLLHYSLQTG